MVFPQMEIKQLARLAAVRPRLRPARALPARVPAGHLPDHAARPGRRLAGQGGDGRQLPGDLRGHPQRQGPGGPAAAGHAVPAAAVQRHGRPQDRAARRHARAWPASTATSTATPRRRRTWWATSGRSRTAAASTRRACAGVNIQRLFGSQRALKTVEDFTEFEQRAAYFDGDQVSAAAKGINPLERGSQVHFMAEVQDLLDFPPAPGLGSTASSTRRSSPPTRPRCGPGAVLRQGPVRRPATRRRTTPTTRCTT